MHDTENALKRLQQQRLRRQRKREQEAELNAATQSSLDDNQQAHCHEMENQQRQHRFEVENQQRQHRFEVENQQRQHRFEMAKSDQKHRHDMQKIALNMEGCLQNAQVFAPWMAPNTWPTGQLVPSAYSGVPNQPGFSGLTGQGFTPQGSVAAQPISTMAPHGVIEASVLGQPLSSTMAPNGMVTPPVASSPSDSEIQSTEVSSVPPTLPSRHPKKGKKRSAQAIEKTDDSDSESKKAPTPKKAKKSKKSKKSKQAEITHFFPPKKEAQDASAAPEAAPTAVVGPSRAPKLLNEAADSAPGQEKLCAEEAQDVSAAPEAPPTTVVVPSRAPALVNETTGVLSLDQGVEVTPVSSTAMTVHGQTNNCTTLATNPSQVVMYVPVSEEDRKVALARHEDMKLVKQDFMTKYGYSEEEAQVEARDFIRKRDADQRHQQNLSVSHLQMMQAQHNHDQKMQNDKKTRRAQEKSADAQEMSAAAHRKSADAHEKSAAAQGKSADAHEKSATLRAEDVETSKKLLAAQEKDLNLKQLQEAKAKFEPSLQDLESSANLRFLVITFGMLVVLAFSELTTCDLYEQFFGFTDSSVESTTIYIWVKYGWSCLEYCFPFVKRLLPSTSVEYTVDNSQSVFSSFSSVFSSFSSSILNGGQEEDLLQEMPHTCVWPSRLVMACLGVFLFFGLVSFLLGGTAGVTMVAFIGLSLIALRLGSIPHYCILCAVFFLCRFLFGLWQYFITCKRKAQWQEADHETMITRAFDNFKRNSKVVTRVDAFCFVLVVIWKFGPYLRSKIDQFIQGW